MIKSNKWTRGAIPALLLHCSIGTVYCWSFFNGSIENVLLKNNVDASYLGWAFSLAIFFLGMSAAFLGDFVEKNVKRASLIATICFTIGVAGTGLAIRLCSLPLIMLFYGVIMGVGLGFGYLAPVKTLMLWFENNKGLATGLAVAGFGVAKMIFTPLIEELEELFSIEYVFYILSIVWFIMMFIGFLLLKKPEHHIEYHQKHTLKSFIQRFKIFKDKKYVGIWLVFYINVTCGLILISKEKEIYDVIGLTGMVGAVFSTITALFNTLGRIVYSSVGDKLKDRNTVFKIILSSELIISVVAVLTNSIRNDSLILVIITILLLLIVNAGFGGCYSNLPTLLGDFYGMEKLSTMYGIALSAWAFAGLTGNQVADLILNKTNDFKFVLLFIAVLFLIATLIDFIVVNHHKTCDEIVK